MPLNVGKMKGGNGGGNFVKQPVLEPGTYPARIAQIIDLGMQPQRAFKGTEKPPRPTIMITYELVDEFLIDEDGNELEDKPRWLHEDFPLYPLDSDRAKSTKRYKAIDPAEDFGGDFSQCLAAPVNVLVNTYFSKKAEEERNGVGDISAVRPKDARKMEELKNEPKLFTLDDPDLDVFNSLPEWLQDKIKGNLEYAGSRLQELLEGTAEPKKNPEPEEVEEQEKEEEEAPWDDEDDWENQ